MATKPRVRWDANANAWRSDVGPIKNGKRRTAKFFRELPNTERGRKQAQRALEDYLVVRDDEETRRTDSGDMIPIGELVSRFLAHFGELVEVGDRSKESLRSHGDRLHRFLSLVDDRGTPLGERAAST